MLGLLSVLAIIIAYNINELNVVQSYNYYEGFDVSVKGLLGYANSKTDRKILDNTTATGTRTLAGEYDSYYAVVGSALSKNFNLDKDLNANLTFGVDLTSEFRDSYNENLYLIINSSTQFSHATQLE